MFHYCSAERFGDRMLSQRQRGEEWGTVRQKAIQSMREGNRGRTEQRVQSVEQIKSEIRSRAAESSGFQASGAEQTEEATQMQMQMM